MYIFWSCSMTYEIKIFITQFRAVLRIFKGLGKYLLDLFILLIQYQKIKISFFLNNLYFAALSIIKLI